MQDNLTIGEIWKSVLRHRLRNPSRIEAQAQCARMELRHGSYAAGVKAGEVEPWERGFAHVVIVQDFLRALAGRTADGTLIVGPIDRAEPPAPGMLRAPATPTVTAPYIAPEESDPSMGLDERDAYERAIEAAELDYVHDPGWRNGGVSAYGGDPVTDEDRESRGEPKTPNLRGLSAFLCLEHVGAIPELGWYYSGSARELGVSSTFAAMVFTLLTGRVMGSQGSAQNEGPSPDQIAAARLQRLVRRRLAQLPAHQQANLEIAYTDRTYDARLVGQYGEGLAALVWRAARAAGECDENGIVTVGSGTLEVLVRVARQDAPEYGARDGLHRTIEERVLMAARFLLRTAHESYEAALQGSRDPVPPRRPRRGPRNLVELADAAMDRRELAAAPTRGRRFIEIHRRGVAA